MFGYKKSVDMPKVKLISTKLSREIYLSNYLISQLFGVIVKNTRDVSQRPSQLPLGDGQYKVYTRHP